MMYKNGFFQLVIKNEGVFLKIFPARAGGKPLDFDEMSAYLKRKKIVFDVAAIHSKIKGAVEPILIRLGADKVYPENEKLLLKMDSNRMIVIGRFIPPSTGGGTQMKREDIINEMAFMGIHFGVDKDAIERYLENREYCTDIVLARGQEPRQGYDAKIVYHFETHQDSRPKHNEDGSVNFHDLNIISQVSAGDLLATLVPEDPGEPGHDVNGKVLKPHPVKRLALKPGKNVTMSADGLHLYSAVSGHVSLEQERVCVSNTYIVPANVDTATGDIDYDGSVEIKGNVVTGYSVIATGDVVVSGVVEGATIHAGGQIVLMRGIQGMNKGSLTAGTNVIAKFIENSEVNAGGYVSTDAILHSNVTAKGDITVDGKKGFVTGGNIRSGSLIEVKTAGSTMGTRTCFEVGIDPDILDEYHDIEKQIGEREKEKQQNLQTLALYKKKLEKGETLPADKQLQMRFISNSYKKLEKEVEALLERQNELAEQINEFESGCVKVKEIAYPGVKITISSAVYYVNNEVRYSQFVRDGADVKVTAL